MPQWLQGVFAPTLMLWLYVVASSAAAAISPDGRLSSSAEYISRMAFSLIIASWLLADARKRQQRLCYDYDSFVFFFWPVVLPVYLFRTRGWRAFLTLLCFAGIWLIAMLAALVVFAARELVLTVFSG